MRVHELVSIGNLDSSQSSFLSNGEAHARRPDSMDQLKGGTNEFWISPEGKLITADPAHGYYHHQEMINAAIGGKYLIGDAIENGWTRGLVEEKVLGFQTRDLDPTRVMLMEDRVFEVFSTNPSITDIYIDVELPVRQSVVISRSEFEQSALSEPLAREYSKLAAGGLKEREAAIKAADKAYDELIDKLMDRNPLEVLEELRTLKQSLVKDAWVADETPTFRKVELAESSLMRALEPDIRERVRYRDQTIRYGSLYRSMSEVYKKSLENYEKQDISHYNFRFPEGSITYDIAKVPIGDTANGRDHWSRLQQIVRTGERIDLYDVDLKKIDALMERRLSYDDPLQAKIEKSPAVGKVDPKLKSYSRPASPEVPKPVEVAKPRPSPKVEIRPRSSPKFKGLDFIGDEPDPKVTARYLFFVDKSAKRAVSAPIEDQTEIFWNSLRGRDAFEQYTNGALPKDEFLRILDELEQEIKGPAIWPWAIVAAAGVGFLTYFLFRKSRRDSFLSGRCPRRI